MIKTLQIREKENLELMIEYASLAGYKDISLGFESSEDTLLLRDDYKKELEKICKLLDKYNLNCIQTHLPAVYHLLVSSEEVNERLETAIKRGIEASAILGAKWTAFHPRTAINDGYNRKISCEHNKKFLTEYLEDAEKYGVGIAVENMPLYPQNNPEYRFFGGGYEELVDLCDDFKSDKIGICWDFGHAHTAAIDQVKALRYIGERLKITHVHDNFKNGDHHILPLLGGLEWGCIDWEKVMPVLKEINYNGPLTLEILFPQDSMLKSFIKTSHDCLSCLIEYSKN